MVKLARTIRGRPPTAKLRGREREEPPDDRHPSKPFDGPAEFGHHASNGRSDRHAAMYDDEDDDRDYEPRRRSSLVPILTIVASLLAIGVGAAVVLFFLGVFDGRQTGTKVASEPPRLATDESRVPQQPADEPEPLSPPSASPETPDVPEAVVTVAPPAPGEPPVRSSHGDWQIRCDTPAGAQNEQCVLMQFVTAEDRENVGLTVIILKTADRKAKIMRILAPLGVLLPSGLGLKIDQTDMGRAGFVRCLPNGCVAEVILEDKLVETLRTGKTATFVIFQTPEEGIGIPISLNGFGPGFDTLP
jgi:invasion protein IalB